MILDIVTPTRRLVDSASADAVKLPTPEGEISVLPGHAALVSLLGTGVLTLVKDGKERLFVVSHGFAEVNKDKMMVLAETCEESHEIDKDRALTALKKAEEALKGTLSESQYRKQQLKLQRALIRTHLAH